MREPYNGPGHWAYVAPQEKQHEPENAEKMPRYASADQEAHLQHRLNTLIEMVRGIDAQVRVRADEALQKHAVQGAVNGCSLELLRLFDLKPQHINLMPYSHLEKHVGNLDKLEKFGIDR